MLTYSSCRRVTSRQANCFHVHQLIEVLPNGRMPKSDWPLNGGASRPRPRGPCTIRFPFLQKMIQKCGAHTMGRRRRYLRRGRRRRRTQKIIFLHPVAKPRRSMGSKFKLEEEVEGTWESLPCRNEYSIVLVTAGLRVSALLLHPEAAEDLLLYFRHGGEFWAESSVITDSLQGRPQREKDDNGRRIFAPSNRIVSAAFPALILLGNPVRPLCCNSTAARRCPQQKPRKDWNYKVVTQIRRRLGQGEELPNGPAAEPRKLQLQ